MLRDILAKRRIAGATLVFTNGCFDLLHAGHIHLLTEAKKFGDILVVGINSDASVKKIKGDPRPITSAPDRATILASMEAVDYVVVFEETDPLSLIKEISPDVLVKGGDWQEGQIVGRELVHKVVRVPYKKGYSTTAIIEAILRSTRPG
jgi:D-beta-D-heptose 7-phosphate kinase/D-beta-D-heptose 1-phosphate adenosyltransferase